MRAVESADRTPASQAEAPLSALTGQTTAADLFSRLATELHDSAGVGETVQAVVEFALPVLGCSHAGVALQTKGSPEVPAATDPVVEQIYRWQMEGGVGPLVVSMRERRTILVRDTACETRWPDWCAKVLSLGVRSVLDIPLMTASGTVGVLGLYSASADAFDADDEAIAQILARHAAVAVASARTEENLERAVDTRRLVGQAMGILMERYGVDEARAFAILRRYSQVTNTKLRDVAAQLVDTRRLPRQP
ncbi:GAF and ANTAR domain-containing protein [Kribbella sp. NPDC004875]|uniref:GAF and ANTAR domain-containing protein n=1 Tax=Kribbella sp. NPDC004875 TaxID=3364107 RepID=UPI00369D3D12